MNRSSIFAVWVGCCLALLLYGCIRQEKPGPDTRKADEAAIRQADNAWSKTAEAKQLDGYLGFFLEDAVVLGPNEPIKVGREAIRETLAAIFETPGMAVKWQASKVEVACSGDLGYSRGTYELTMDGPDGKPIVDHGKYMTIWKKQADGCWKVAVDMNNSDLPASQTSE